MNLFNNNTYHFEHFEPNKIVRFFGRIKNKKIVELGLKKIRFTFLLSTHFEQKKNNNNKNNDANEPAKKIVDLETISLVRQTNTYNAN